jgi:predicted Zn-dependent protease
VKRAALARVLAALACVLAALARVLAALACVLGLAACGSPPPRKEGAAPAPPRRPPVLATPQADADAGREGAKEVEAAIGVVTDPALRAYVQEVGARLARNAPGFRYDYQFEIADQAAPNAFALPGGRIYISRGALALTASEDELANVLGHEIAHVASRHAAAQQQVAGGSFMQVLQFQSLAAYSRDLESTADRLGQGLAAVSGYDPNGMATFLAALDRLDRFESGTSRRTGFLDSHPGTPGRAHEMAVRAGTMHWQRSPGRAADPAAHLRRIAGVVLGDDPAQGVFVGPRFLHADLAFTLRFPDGFETVNTPAAVAAIAPDRSLQIVLELAGRGHDLAAAAEAFTNRLGRSLAVAQAGPLRVAGREAFRLTGSAGGAPFMSTFLAHRGAVYQLSCVGSSRSRLEALCNVTTRSFRPMTPELLAEVSVLRLALAEARAGESLGDLGGRSRNAWGVAETAAWNGLSLGAPLRAGGLVKVAERAPYLPRSGN